MRLVCVYDLVGARMRRPSAEADQEVRATTAANTLSVECTAAQQRRSERWLDVCCCCCLRWRPASCSRLLVWLLSLTRSLARSRAGIAKVLVVGNVATGKTSVINRFARNKFSKVSNTRTRKEGKEEKRRRRERRFATQHRGEEGRTLTTVIAPAARSCVRDQQDYQTTIGQNAAARASAAS